MILLAGGTGTLGTRLVPRLTARGIPVRVLTRDPTRAQLLGGPGVEVVQGDVRDPDSLRGAVQGAGTVISAVHGFTGTAGVSPASVDRAGNANLIAATATHGAHFILLSVVGAADRHPMELFRAKHAAEQALRASGTPWTIVRATAFLETWQRIMSQALRDSGKILVFGRGDNPINFVSAADVAALVERSAVDASLRNQTLEICGPDNLTFNELAARLLRDSGRQAPIRHVPRPALRLMAALLALPNPALARQARAAIAMDTLDMTRQTRANHVGGPASEPEQHPSGRRAG